MRKEVIIIEKGTDGTYSAYPSTLKSTIIGEGISAEDAKKDFANTYKEVLASFTENGEEIPAELKDLEFEFKYDLSAFFNCFKFINVSKFAEAIGIEPSLMRHYKVGKTSISEAQAKKIERGIHTLASELQRVTL